jgi:hypothetical protein
VKRAKTMPMTPIRQVYAPKVVKSPCGDIARIPLYAEGAAALSLVVGALELDEAHAGGCDHRLELGVNLQLLDQVADVPFHCV